MQKILPGDIFLIFGGLVLGLGLAHTYFSSTAEPKIASSNEGMKTIY